MVGPSAIGSEKGSPSSRMSTPPSISALAINGVYLGSGSPAVTYPMSPPSPRDFKPSKTSVIALIFSPSSSQLWFQRLCLRVPTKSQQSTPSASSSAPTSWQKRRRAQIPEQAESPPASTTSGKRLRLRRQLQKHTQLAPE